MRIKVVTLGTSIQMPMVTGAKGHLIVPFDASKTIADISLKVKCTICLCHTPKRPFFDPSVLY